MGEYEHSNTAADNHHAPVMMSLNWPLGSRRVNAPFVSMGPGAMPTNRMPYRPHSDDSDLVSAATPALAAADGTT